MYQTLDRLDVVKNAFNCKLQDFSFSAHLSPQTQGDVLEQTPVHSLIDHNYTNKKDETHNPTIPQNGQTHSNNSLGICRQIVWVCLTILWGWRLKSSWKVQNCLIQKQRPRFTYNKITYFVEHLGKAILLSIFVLLSELWNDVKSWPKPSSIHPTKKAKTIR